jgi:hypothetical protein
VGIVDVAMTSQVAHSVLHSIQDVKTATGYTTGEGFVVQESNQLYMVKTMESPNNIQREKPKSIGY